MRGVVPVNLPVPSGGLVLNQRPDQVAQSALIDGLNMVLDADGLYKVRPGYAPFISTPTTNTKPVLGMLWYVDIDGTYRYVKVTRTDIWAVVGGLWAKVTGTALTGSDADPVRIVDFFQGDKISALIANNHDPIQLWRSDLATAIALTPTYGTAGGPAAYTANTTPTFTSYPSNTQIFVTFPQTNSGACTLALNGLAAKAIKAVQLGVLSDLPLDYLVVGQVYNLSFDGTQFVIGTNVVAPACRDIAIVAERVVAINCINGNVRRPSQVQWTEAFDGTAWPALAYQNLLDTDDPLIAIRAIGQFSAIVHGEESAWLMEVVPGASDAGAFSFTPIAGVAAGPVSSANPMVVPGGDMYLARDKRIYLCDGTKPTPISPPVDKLLRADLDTTNWTRSFSLFLPELRLVLMCFPSRFSTLPGCIEALAYSVDRQTFEVKQLFTQGFNAGVMAGEFQSTTWDRLKNDWSSYTQAWDSFPTVARLSALLGGNDGEVYRLGLESGNDNGAAIPFSFTPPLLEADDMSDVLVDSLDLFLDPSATLEVGQIVFYGMRQPYDPSPVDALAFAFNMSDASTFSLPISLPSANTYYRYMKAVVSGSTIQRNLNYGGMLVYFNRQQRASK